ncbi:hypothetical protein [Achromobacter sp. HZ28]|uniref:hypothetical protein n=2 Tax=unclassified Achromobacter TaxID=2626865 RepID=UPI000B517404|nr:hypothetical protein [Achromobacter sp. HZ28]OWT80290.1 hypothetical protein CEY05_02430 [Achromobacter sp. HZ34]OWT82173.1 hypothetical protein CEY04_02430 [Achromobacter sp. HZ28]
MLIEAGAAGSIPWVMLRPRTLDPATVFDGDFDFLVDGARFDEIVHALFTICRDAGVSFALRQTSPFKRQAELLGDAGRRVIVEMWTHAELRTQERGGHLTRAGVAYAEYEKLNAQGREALLAALFLLHLHHKKKALDRPMVAERLAYFSAHNGAVPELSDVLEGLRSGALTLADARRTADHYLRAHGIVVSSPAAIALKRLAWRARTALHWPSWRTTAVVGPDGSGKGALIESIKQGSQGKQFRHQRFKRIFRRPLHHLVQRDPRNVRDEKMLWLVLPTAWTCFTLSRLLTGWGKPLLLDRYFYDYFVRNVRLSTPEPFRRIAAYRLCSALAPRPERLIVAVCTPEIIHERKLEMARDVIEAMYGVYIEQVVGGRLPLTLFCHTGGTLAASERDVEAFLRMPKLA